MNVRNTVSAAVLGVLFGLSATVPGVASANGGVYYSFSLGNMPYYHAVPPSYHYAPQPFVYHHGYPGAHAYYPQQYSGYHGNRHYFGKPRYYGKPHGYGGPQGFNRHHRYQYRQPGWHDGGHWQPRRHHWHGHD